MPMYLYETIPSSPSELPDRFELRQSMAEPCLTQHPETGAPVRRVLSGGLTTLMRGTGAAPLQVGQML